MRISEVFASIQGEGVSVGTPSVFIRLAECNLACRWCDTRYTWDWERYDRSREVVEMAVGDVAAKAINLAAAARTIVITGGEPLLQQPQLVELIDHVRDKLAELRVEVETSGTIEPLAELAARVTQWNVSPKLASSGNLEKARLRAGPLAWFAAAPNAQWKLVAVAESDLDEIADLVERWHVPADRVTVMPECTDV